METLTFFFIHQTSPPKCYIQIIGLQTLEDVVKDLGGSSLAAHIGGKELGLIQVSIDSSVDLSSSTLLAKELQHESNTTQGSNGVSNTLALDIGGTTVARLTNSEAITNVSGGNQTQRTDKGSSTVRQNVTVQVRSNNDIVVLGLAEQLVDHGVDDLLLDVDGGEALGGEGLAGGLTEQAVGLGQNVGLVGDGDHGRGVGGGDGGRGADVLAAESDLTGDGGNARRGPLGNALDGLGDLAVGTLLGCLLLHVQVLGVLADDDQVNGLAVAAAGGGLDGADVGVQVELLAESDDGRRVTGDLGAGGAKGV